MAMIRTTCPECKTRYRVDESHAEKRTRCKKCGAEFVISSSEHARSVSASSAVAPPSTAKSREEIEEAEQDVPLVWDVGDVILDLYEVTAVLGEGGFGTVYKVHHREWNMDLAVKCPKPGKFETERQVESFERECETWVNLGLHPNTVWNAIQAITVLDPACGSGAFLFAALNILEPLYDAAWRTVWVCAGADASTFDCSPTSGAHSPFSASLPLCS